MEVCGKKHHGKLPGSGWLLGSKPGLENGLFVAFWNQLYPLVMSK